MKLSILDQAPISTGKTAYDALQSSVKLAQLGERLGYTRFWIAEHHDLFGLACPNPDVMLGIIGAQTSRIRIGAGAVLIPYYKPFRVAETYNLLATMFPNRIDLGLGRAPGGSAEVSMALSDNYLEQVRLFPNSVDELLQFLKSTFPKDHLYSKITPTPIPQEPPQVWLLGTSEKSAALAAEKGMAYAFGHFMSGGNGPEIVEKYRQSFTEKRHQKAPYVIVAVSVICAETTEEANDLAMSNIVWAVKQDTGESAAGVPSVKEAKAYPLSPEAEEKVRKIKQNSIIGNPVEVKKRLHQIKTQYKADEIMVVSIIHDEMMKFLSYQLLADQLLR
ncbi:LLM class flavin-dependent oxidoreductase [Virgibacillus sp. W0181]|uniref:LLM class flavin-dependent oxidoreductase n=1 Tax=Virgibacillus sp. W0181 TaxID=3391581 RepID=UPI003F46C4AF